MTFRTASWIGAASWLVMAAALWTLLVPGALSLAAFAWLNTAIFGLVVVSRVMWHRTRVAPSVTRMLHELERQPRAVRW